MYICCVKVDMGGWKRFSLVWSRIGVLQGKIIVFLKCYFLEISYVVFVCYNQVTF